MRTVISVLTLTALFYAGIQTFNTHSRASSKMTPAAVVAMMR